jgi:glycosyltransferase involved in cell wall biosynthesis
MPGKHLNMTPRPDHLALLRSTELFDAAWYLATYPDVARSGLSAESHFLTFGALLGRDPGPGFNTQAYLETYPDVREAGANALLHFLQNGQKENRLITPVAVPAAKAAWHGLPPEEGEPQIQPGETLGLCRDKLEHVADSAPDLSATLEGLQSVFGEFEPEIEKRRAKRNFVQPYEDRFPLSVREPKLKPASKEKRILWVLNKMDRMTCQYRGSALAAALAPFGWQSTIVLDDELTRQHLANVAIMVVIRCEASNNLVSLMRGFRTAGGTVVYDVDDFIIDPECFTLLHSYRRRSRDDRVVVGDRFIRCRQALMEASFATVSTWTLGREVEALGIASYVMPNNIDATKHGHLPKKRNNGDIVKICYLSGTRSHDEDFLEAAAAVETCLMENANCEFHIVGQLTRPASMKGLRIKEHPLMTHDDMLAFLSRMDINIAPLACTNKFTNCKSELKIYEAAFLGIPTVASPTAPYAATIQHGKDGYLADTAHGWETALRALIEDASLRQAMGKAAADTIARRFHLSEIAKEADALYSAALSHPEQMRKPAPTRQKQSGAHKPKLSIVSILYAKEKEPPYLLDSVRRQDFEHPFELILIDDRSPDNSADVVAEFERWNQFASEQDPHLSVRILHNRENMGNCGSRNKGIQAAKSDIIVIVDADCMLNRSFVRQHYQAYQQNDCDIVIGPKGIETNDRHPLAVLGLFEADPQMAERNARPQDPTNQDSFINCVTRNFSIRKSFVTEKLDESLFDEAFAYSRDPESGFGWEDVELGCRAYKAGARIKYLRDTFSIHCSHPTSEHSGDKPLRSLRNFRRLHQKHPELYLTCRQWTKNTYSAILNWIRHIGKTPEGNADYEWLEQHFGSFPAAPAIIKRNRPLRVLTHRWHCPHQYELYKLGHDFTLATNTGNRLCNVWEWGKRPLPSNARMVDAESIDEKDYDVAIIHFDENVLSPERCNNMVPDNWGLTFNWFLENLKLPKIAICHGTPQFHGQYQAKYDKDDLGQVIESERERFVTALRDVHVVCNSHQAHGEWQFNKSSVIWHGFAPSDYPPMANDGGVLCMQYDALTNRPHYNGLFVFDELRELLGDEVAIQNLKVPNPHEAYASDMQAWAVAKYQNYVRALGQFSVYLNPTLRSPMPRTRGEAMMAGLISVSRKNHDVDMFIKNGVNGFYSDSNEELTDHLRFLGKNEGARSEIRKASLETAHTVFNQDNYLAKWSELLKSIAG